MIERRFSRHFTLPIVQKANEMEIDINDYENTVVRDARFTWPNAASVRDVQSIEQEHASNRERVCGRDPDLETVNWQFLTSSVKRTVSRLSLYGTFVVLSTLIIAFPLPSTYARLSVVARDWFTQIASPCISVSVLFNYDRTIKDSHC